MSDNKTNLFELFQQTKDKNYKKWHAAMLIAAAVIINSYMYFAWQKHHDTSLIVISALLLIVAALVLNMRAKHCELTQKKKELLFQEILNRNLFEQAPVGIILRESRHIAPTNRKVSLNPQAESIIGRKADDFENLDWTKITHPDDLNEEIPLFEQFLRKDISSYTVEKRLMRPDGSYVWVRILASDFKSDPPYDSMYICFVEDISERKASEQVLHERERSTSVLLSHIPGMAYRCKDDIEWTMEFVSEGCFALTGYAEESLIDNAEVSYKDVIAPDYRQRVWEDWERAIRLRKSYIGEYEIITKSGERKWVLENGQPIYDRYGGVEALEGIIFDFTEQKRKDQKITYLQERDFLTDLYNREYMDKALKKIDVDGIYPTSIAICDIDGLRMINSAFGHNEGDRLITVVGKLIQSCLKPEWTLARMGGGEFMILLPGVSSEDTHRLKIDIKHTIESFNLANQDSSYAVNLSIGHSTKQSQMQRMEDVIVSAESYLQRRKLLNQNSTHSAIVSSVMATLYAKSQETEIHGIRLDRLCKLIGEELDLDQKSLDDLQLLAKLHDIGKIGTDDRILNKPSKLTVEEWEEMKQHPKIGYEIAMTIPHLEHIAEYILYHHERWDGFGYPAGLKGEAIPLVSRILAVADAYDAMTESRIYRDAMPKHLAIEEIVRCAGTQFDPDIVDTFIRVIEQWRDI